MSVLNSPGLRSCGKCPRVAVGAMVITYARTLTRMELPRCGKHIPTDEARATVQALLAGSTVTVLDYWCPEDEHRAQNTCAYCVGSGVVEDFDGDVPCARCDGRGHLHDAAPAGDDPSLPVPCSVPVTPRVGSGRPRVAVAPGARF